MSKNERFSRGNLIFLFVVAILIGAITKNIVSDHVRIGFDDPTTVIERGELYDIDKLEQKLLHEGLPVPVNTEDSVETKNDNSVK